MPVAGIRTVRFDRLLEGLRVDPNPFRVQAHSTFADDDRLRIAQ